jgi:hypothetical protein
MTTFQSQLWNGYKFELYRSGFIRIFLSYFYHYKFLYFNGSQINFDLNIGIPRHKTILEPIKYEWQLINRKTKRTVKNGSGFIEFTIDNKNNIKATSDGKALEKVNTYDGYKFAGQRLLTKAIQLGYMVDDLKCLIKMKFVVGEQEFNSEPMAVFNIYDKDDIHKASIELLRGAISSLHSCIADMFFLKIAFNDTRLLLAAS